MVSAALRTQRLTQDCCWRSVSASQLAHHSYTGALVTIIFASSDEMISTSAVIVTRRGTARGLCKIWKSGSNHGFNHLAPLQTTTSCLSLAQPRSVPHVFCPCTILQARAKAFQLYIPARTQCHAFGERELPANPSDFNTKANLLPAQRNT